MGPGTNKLGSGIPAEQGEFPESSVPTRYGDFDTEQTGRRGLGHDFTKLAARIFDTALQTSSMSRNRSHPLPRSLPATQRTTVPSRQKHR